MKYYVGIFVLLATMLFSNGTVDVVFIENVYATSTCMLETKYNLFDTDKRTSQQTMKGADPDEGVFLEFRASIYIDKIDIIVPSIFRQANWIKLAEIGKCEVASIGVFKQGMFKGSYIRFPNFELYHIKAGKGFSEDSDPEHHENTFEICMVISGKVKITVGMQSYILKPKMAVRFKAMHSHYYDILEEAEFLLIHHNAL